MRTPRELVHSRARVEQRYALFPLEGYPPSRLPAWPGAAARVLASPALGAGFVESLVDLGAGQAGGYPADGRTETFLFLRAGRAELTVDTDRSVALAAGGFALVPPARGFVVTAIDAASLLVLRKVYEPLVGTPAADLLVGREAEVPAEVYMGNESALLQSLIPDTPAHDLAMNIFTFAPGHGLPVVETHVMEHGLLVLQGKGLYYLDDTWMEVATDDFIWMGPYVPQSFYATGTTPARYIYYKNVNRDVSPA
jgi:(S)-ureidoglycine aminohydrolase